MNWTEKLSQQTKALKPPALRRITLQVQKVNGINLGQGVCQLPVPEDVLDAAAKAARDGINLYTNPKGLQSLREALAMKFERDNGIAGLDPEQEIIVTCGATGAFEAICAVLLDPGDEVVVFEPSYPYHMQCLNRYGAKITVVPLNGPEWNFDPEALKAALTPRTKFILVNTPNNPTGKVFTQDEFCYMASLLEGTETLLVTDEIYEYMVFEGKKHVSAASMPELKGRVLTMGGYSKTFSITGWRIGYLVAPKELSAVLTAIVDAIYVCPPAPLQQAVAHGIQNFTPEFYTKLSEKYDRKRNLFAQGLREIGITPNVPLGAYYMIASYEKLSPELQSSDFVARMIETVGVGAVPSEDFVRNPEEAKWVRFCLAVEDSVLEAALGRLRQLDASMVKS